MKYFSLLTVLFFSQAAFAQSYFEGSVTYEYRYQSLYKFITTEYIEQNFPVGEIKTYKDSLLMVETFFANKPDTIRSLFNLASGVGYQINPATDTIKRFSFSSFPGTVLKHEKSGMTKEVLGENCSSVHLAYIADRYRGKKVDAVYYYSPTYPLDPVYYADFEEDFFYLYAQKAQAVPLASSVSYENLYRVDALATKIEEKAIEEDFFALPEEKVVVPR